MHTLHKKLTRDEALREIDSFVAELDAGWQRDRLDWAPELLALLREFRSASDAEQFVTLRERLHIFLSAHKLKGIDYLLSWADSVIESYEKPVA